MPRLDKHVRRAGAIALALLLAAPAAAQQPAPPAPASTHARPWPPFLGHMDPRERAVWAEHGLEVAFDAQAREALEEHRRLAAALEALRPQRRGTVDAYVLSVALDSDPVFGREAREAGRVLARRYGAEGRTITLAAADGATDELPRGSLAALGIVLARIAELIDREEDVLILYVTTHGAPIGLAAHHRDQGFGLLGPTRLAALFAELGLANRLVIVNACFSGVFVPALASETSVIIAAAAPDRASFGCAPSNDWTYFGDALVNRALRERQPLAEAFEEARATVARWESARAMTPSDPRIDVGADAARWLAPLERRIPRGETRPVGRPAAED